MIQMTKWVSNINPVAGLEVDPWNGDQGHHVTGGPGLHLVNVKSYQLRAKFGPLDKIMLTQIPITNSL